MECPPPRTPRPPGAPIRPSTVGAGDTRDRPPAGASADGEGGLGGEHVVVIFDGREVVDAREPGVARGRRAPGGRDGVEAHVRDVRVTTPEGQPSGEGIAGLGVPGRGR
ncbi:hypothetical protein ElP_27200 [Tautonia plasticadhaerens]|uniref:Uncharacterized protein n=1 Tax=Tautonia plasticadhaerens TaxID=2527974 RepID=A0A518H1X4_9BACT|nr:hypothetical protein ElP_27200 [Tautonia plasticadhaerens]